MKKKIISLLLVATLTLNILLSANNITLAAEKTSAQKLNDLGLMLDVSYEDLNAELTRAVGIAVILKAMGVDQETANAYMPSAIRFTDDLGSWYSGYAELAYVSGITAGVTENSFGGHEQLTARMFTTWMLRALGYDSSEAWYETDELAVSVGLIPYGYTLGDLYGSYRFTKGDAAEIICNALTAQVQGTGQILLEDLINYGVVTQDAAIAAGLMASGTTSTQTTITEEQKYSVSGYITDESTGAVLSNVFVEITVDESTYSMYSDSNGYFYMELNNATSSSELDIWAELGGYDPYLINYVGSIGDDKNISNNIQLKKNAVAVNSASSSMTLDEYADAVQNSTSLSTAIYPFQMDKFIQITRNSKNDTWYKFTGKAGEGYTIALHAILNSGYMKVFVYDENGKSIFEGTGNSYITNDGYGIIGGKLAIDGTYYVKVSGYVGTYDIGFYNQYFNNANSQSDQRDFFGSLMTSKVLQSGTYTKESNKLDNFYRVHLLAGQTLSVSITAYINSGYLSAHLCDENGRRVSTSGYIANGKTATFTKQNIAIEGDYFIQVTGLTVGTYDISYNIN